jgi:hypothetical protein
LDYVGDYLISGYLPLPGISNRFRRNGDWVFVCMSFRDNLERKLLRAVLCHWIPEDGDRIVSEILFCVLNNRPCIESEIGYS